MTEINCESIRIAAMALADGEESPASLEQIEMHLRRCESCREEVDAVLATNELWSSHQRLVPSANVWPIVNERLEATSETTAPFNWRVLLLFALPMFGYKVLLLVFHAGPSVWSKLVPLILAIAVFAYLKTNPFKINCELSLRGELSA